MSDARNIGQSGQARGMDAQRVRRSSLVTDEQIGPPLTLDNDGRITLSLEGALEVTADGTLRLRVGDGLEVAPGSPLSLRVKLGQGLATGSRGALEARVAAVDVKLPDGSSVVAGLAGKQALSEKGQPGGYAGLDGSGYVAASAVPLPDILTLNGYPADSSKVLFGDATFGAFLGTTSATAAAGDDSRLSDARAPTAHASAHQPGGGDEVSTATPAAGAIPKAEGSGLLNSRWIPAQTSVVFHALSHIQAPFTAMPAAETLLASHHRHVVKCDLTGMSQARLCLNKMGTAGVAGSKLILRYSSTYGTTAGTYTADVGTSEISVPMDATDTYQVSAWVDLAAGAKADVFLAIIGSGGNGTTGPQYGGLHAQFR